MTPFEYLAVLISIVLGFGLTELLGGVQRLVHHRERVRLYWLPLAWTALVFVALVQWWWAAFGLRGRMDWNFFSFLLTLAVPVLYYMAAALVLPARETQSGFDLEAHYFGVKHIFFGTVAAATALEAVRAVAAGDPQAASLNLLGTGLLASLAVIGSRRYHAVATLLAAGLLATFIVVETLLIS